MKEVQKSDVRLEILEKMTWCHFFQNFDFWILRCFVVARQFWKNLTRIQLDQAPAKLMNIFQNPKIYAARLTVH